MLARMALARHSPRRDPLLFGLSALGVGALVVLAARADSSVPRASRWLTALDVAVGLAFVVAARVSNGSVSQRLLVAGVGVSWLAASPLPRTALVPQALLVVSLVAFPSGRIRGAIHRTFVVVAILVGLEALPVWGVAIVFFAIPITAVATGRGNRTAVWYPTVAAIGVGGALLVSWLSDTVRVGRFDPTVSLVTYELVLVLVAVAFPVAAQAAIRARAKLADELLTDAKSGALDRLVAVLRPALGDPRLRVFRWDEEKGAYLDEAGHPVAPRDGRRRWLAVDDPGGPVAVMSHRSPAMDDAPTAAAVTSAVRLTVTNLRLQEEQRLRLRELEASRARLQAAADGARERAFAELREHVDGSLQLALSEVGSVISPARHSRPESAAALDVVVQELAAATGEIADLVAGVPPGHLGGGRLPRALGALARRSAVPVSVTVATDAAAGPEAEAALFYVCSEALTNAVKHAGARLVTISIGREGGAVVATVADDGRGGADPAGSGLMGLADRLAAHGGRLRVHSPPGAGTTVVATMPG